MAGSSSETVKEEFKKLSIAEGERLKNVAAAEGTTEQKKIMLITNDDVIFEVDLFITEEMKKVQSLIEENGGHDDDAVVIEISNVSSHSLSLIIEYCAGRCRVAEADNAKEKLKLLDEKFVERLNMNELRGLLLAAKNLNMKNFLDFLYQSVANLLKNNSVQFARDFFGVENDFTPQEEAQIRKTQVWAFRD